MNALLEFSFEDWEKSQFADLVVDIIDDDSGCSKLQVPVENAIWRKEHKNTSDAFDVLYFDAIINGESLDFSVTHYKATNSWDFRCTGLSEWFDLYIKVR